MQLPEFSEKDYDLINEYGKINSPKLFISLFKSIPQKMKIDRVNGYRIRLQLESEMKDQIIHRFYTKKFDSKKDAMGFIRIIYLLANGYLIDLDHDEIAIFFANKEEADAEAFLLQFKILEKEQRKENSISIIIHDNEYGLRTEKLIFKPAAINLDKNYNNDLLEKHPTILKMLKEKNKSGLHLFHGIPGTGKSTYIRQLIAKQRKEVIFLSPSIAASLDSPNFTKLLLDNVNTILVVEDAEELIISRESGRNSSVAMLLNITDGILGEGLGIQVIATFNTPLGNIDKALLRKGRLLSIYEFKALELTKARSLMQEIGKDPNRLNRPTALADIYHYDENDASTQDVRKNTIGFLSNVN